MLVRGIERVERFVGDGAVKVAGSCETPRGNVVVLDEDLPDGASPAAKVPLVRVNSAPLINGHACFGEATIEHDLRAPFDEVVNVLLFVG